MYLWKSKNLAKEILATCPFPLLLQWFLKKNLSSLAAMFLYLSKTFLRGAKH